MYDIKSGKIKNKYYYFEKEVKINSFEDEKISLNKINVIVLENDEEYKYNAEIKEEVGDDIIFYSSKESMIKYIVKSKKKEDIKKEIKYFKKEGYPLIASLFGLMMGPISFIIPFILYKNEISSEQANFFYFMSLFLVLFFGPIFYFSMKMKKKENKESKRDIKYAENQILRNHIKSNTRQDDDLINKENEIKIINS